MLYPLYHSLIAAIFYPPCFSGIAALCHNQSSPRTNLKYKRSPCIPCLLYTSTIPDLYVSGDAQDTSDFVDYMAHELKADVIIVLGGDGTSRAAAKTIGDIPLIPVSTGTNNVYPQFIEGTVVAIAAAALADNVLKNDDIPRGTLIEVSVSDGQTDIGLIDAVVSRKNCIGARAITDEGDIDAILVTQSHPANIGFSALIGSSNIVLPEDDYGVYAALDWQRRDYVAAISVGVLVRFGFCLLYTSRCV